MLDTQTWQPQTQAICAEKATKPALIHADSATHTYNNYIKFSYKARRGRLGADSGRDRSPPGSKSSGEKDESCRVCASARGRNPQRLPSLRAGDRAGQDKVAKSAVGRPSPPQTSTNQGLGAGISAADEPQGCQVCAEDHRRSPDSNAVPAC